MQPIFDRKFSLDYVKSIKDFLGFLQPQLTKHAWYYSGDQASSVSTMMQQINELVRLLKSSGRAPNRKMQAQSIALEPNLIIPFQNEKICSKKHGCQFFIALGFRLDVNKFGCIANHSISLHVLYHTDTDRDPVEAWHAPRYPAGATVIRKFHFDLDLDLEDADRPLSHLQYGGSRPGDYLIHEGRRPAYELFSPLDDPRIPILPHSFIMGVDLALRAFRTDLATLTRESKWCNLVAESERLWLTHYLQKTLDHLNNPGERRTLWNHISTCK